ncbi:MAG: cytochrome c [Gammaproteobacteria bacterium]|nr:cytochrome c [Gammaproteobacteria bacterium]
MTSSNRYSRKIRNLGCAALLTVAGMVPGAGANEPTTTDREFIEMQTSLNAIMVAVVDWAAHEIWEAGYAETLTGRNWLTTKQYATELLAAGTLVSLGGTGRADPVWVVQEPWQEWTARMIDDTKVILQAIEEQDQAKLLAAGEKLVVTCEGCHADYKPTSPTEGILHVPHHEYGDPLARE